MGVPTGPFRNRSLQYTSATTAQTFDIPIGWVYVVSAGSGAITMTAQNGDTVAYTGCVAGDIIPGPFAGFTSTTCSILRLGDGTPPPSAPSTAAFSQLYANATTTQSSIPLKCPSAFYLLTGAPLAIFANGASAVPGSALVDSKAAAIRWNNNATLNGVLTSFQMPADVDTTKPAYVKVVASKTGATLADAVTFDIGLYNQVVGALDDADTNYGGTTSAMQGDATAKTVQSVSLTLSASDLASFPSSVTMTLKPTDGTLGTDDLCLLEVYVQYTSKILSS